MAENELSSTTRDMPMRDYGIRWSSTPMFVLAVVGAIIGLNNIWQFPYLLGEHGGSLFLLVYVIALLVIGFPLMITELAIGRLGRGSPIQTVRALVDKTHADPNWVVLGSVKTFAGFVVLSFLSVIAGWLLAYTVRASFGVLQGQTEDGLSALFSAFVGDPEKQLFWHSVFVFMTTVVAANGLQRGFERLIRLLVPAMFVLFGVLLVYALMFGQPEQAIRHLFVYDPEVFTGWSFMMAVGHAFFSLGLGYGALMMYGAYIHEETDIARSSFAIIVIELVIGLLSAIMVYALLIKGDLDPVSGPMLVFQSLPLALDGLQYGYLMMPVLFLMLVFIAWLTAIALVEPAIVWLIECHKLSRPRAAIWTGIMVWLLGLVTLFSFNVWAFEFEYFGIKKYLGAFDVMQILTSNYLLPVSGLLLAMFAGWSVEKTIKMELMGIKSKRVYFMWHIAVRYIIPVVLLVVAFSVPKMFL